MSSTSVVASAPTACASPTSSAVASASSATCARVASVRANFSLDDDGDNRSLALIDRSSCAVELHKHGPRAPVRMNLGSLVQEIATQERELFSGDDSGSSLSGAPHSEDRNSSFDAAEVIGPHIKGDMSPIISRVSKTGADRIIEHAHNGSASAIVTSEPTRKLSRDFDIVDIPDSVCAEQVAEWAQSSTNVSGASLDEVPNFQGRWRSFKTEGRGEFIKAVLAHAHWPSPNTNDPTIHGCSASNDNKSSPASASGCSVGNMANSAEVTPVGRRKLDSSDCFEKKEAVWQKCDSKTSIASGSQGGQREHDQSQSIVTPNQSESVGLSPSPQCGEAKALDRERSILSTLRSQVKAAFSMLLRPGFSAVEHYAANELSLTYHTGTNGKVSAMDFQLKFCGVFPVNAVLLPRHPDTETRTLFFRRFSNGGLVYCAAWHRHEEKKNDKRNSLVKREKAHDYLSGPDETCVGKLTSLSEVENSCSGSPSLRAREQPGSFSCSLPHSVQRLQTRQENEDSDSCFSVKYKREEKPIAKLQFLDLGDVSAHCGVCFESFLEFWDAAQEVLLHSVTPILPNGNRLPVMKVWMKRVSEKDESEKGSSTTRDKKRNVAGDLRANYEDKSPSDEEMNIIANAKSLGSSGTRFLWDAISNMSGRSAELVGRTFSKNLSLIHRAFVPMTSFEDAPAGVEQQETGLQPDTEFSERLNEDATKSEDNAVKNEDHAEKIGSAEPELSEPAEQHVMSENSSARGGEHQLLLASPHTAQLREQLLSVLAPDVQSVTPNRSPEPLPPSRASGIFKWRRIDRVNLRDVAKRGVCFDSMYGIAPHLERITLERSLRVAGQGDHIDNSQAQALLSSTNIKLDVFFDMHLQKVTYVYHRNNASDSTSSAGASTGGDQHVDAEPYLIAIPYFAGKMRVIDIFDSSDPEDLLGQETRKELYDDVESSFRDSFMFPLNVGSTSASEPQLDLSLEISRPCLKQLLVKKNASAGTTGSVFRPSSSTEIAPTGAQTVSNDTRQLVCAGSDIDIEKFAQTLAVNLRRNSQFRAFLRRCCVFLAYLNNKSLEQLEAYKSAEEHFTNEFRMLLHECLVMQFGSDGEEDRLDEMRSVDTALTGKAAFQDIQHSFNSIGEMTGRFAEMLPEVCVILSEVVENDDGEGPRGIIEAAPPEQESEFHGPHGEMMLNHGDTSMFVPSWHDVELSLTTVANTATGFLPVDVEGDESRSPLQEEVDQTFLERSSGESASTEEQRLKMFIAVRNSDLVKHFFLNYTLPGSCGLLCSSSPHHQHLHLTKEEHDTAQASYSQTVYRALLLQLISNIMMHDFVGRIPVCPPDHEDDDFFFQKGGFSPGVRAQAFLLDLMPQDLESFLGNSSEGSSSDYVDFDFHHHPGNFDSNFSDSSEDRGEKQSDAREEIYLRDETYNVSEGTISKLHL